MGIWSSSLYESDLAEDLKGAIKALSRLPFTPEKMVEILSQNHSDISGNSTGEEYTTFWLVTADQFHKRGLKATWLFQRALEIIDSGQDLQTLSTLRLPAGELRKRKKVLEGIRAKLTSPLPERKDKPLAEPEPFLMNVGDAIVFPVCRQGSSRNPYLSNSMQTDWKQVAWGAAVIIESGRAFDFLAWYRPLKILEPIPLDQQTNDCIPELQTISSRTDWNIGNAGTCSPSNFRKTQLRLVGRVELDSAKIQQAIEHLPSGAQFAINDISISNELFSGGEKSRNTNLASFLF